MKPQDRDNLLIQIAQDIGGLKVSVQNTYYLTEKQEAHLAKLNESVSKNIVKIAVNGSNIKWLWWTMGIFVT